MRLVDLTLPVPDIENGSPTVLTERLTIESGGTRYAAVIHSFRNSSMSGTYIDIPGHIAHTDDGVRADECPLERLFEVPCSVAHLDRAGYPGKVSADELRAACPTPVGRGLVVNALGAVRFDAVPLRSIALSKEAVGWIIDQGFELLVSDIYEHALEPDNVFIDLFSAGVYTVCHPVNLHLLDGPMAHISALFPRFPGATQLPCRAVARLD